MMLLLVLEIVEQVVDVVTCVRGVGPIEEFGKLGLHVPDLL